METKRYEIPAYAWMSAQEKLAALNKKAARNGIPESTARIVDTYTKEVHQGGPQERPFTETYHTIELDATEIKIEGYTFIAKIEHLEEGNLIFNPSGTGDVGDHWKTAKPHCQHCGHNRHRKETYLIKGMPENFVQVGSTCIKEYTGIDPNRVFKWIEYIADVERLLGSGEHCTPREASYIDTQCYLTHVARIIRTDGWTPRSKADGIMRHATADTSLSYMLDCRDRKVERDEYPTADDAELAQAAVDHIKEVQTSSDYEWNLKVSVKNETVPYKALGIVASLIPYYKRHLEQTIERTAQYDKDKESTHVGTVGKREDFILTLTKMLPLEGGQYGPTYLHKFRDQDGNVVSWFSSKMYFDTPSDNGNVSEALTEGETYTLKATVKKHDDYQGIPQTLITRAKILWPIEK